MKAPKGLVPPREVIAGRYKIESALGQGGMGSVWRAQHLTLRSPVAIKLIDPARASSEEAVMRFLREAQSAAALRSPHVVQILDHGVDAGVPYIAMELLDGESLAARLERVGKLSPAETSRIMTHVGRAMSRAHEAGIVHRDLKPENVFLVRNDDEEIAKVLDFGIAKTSGSSAFDVTTGTRTGELLGTPYYMSPEQVEGQKALDHRTDLWAMAVIAFECLVGSRPFESDTLGSLLLQICAKPIPVPSKVGPVPPAFDAWFAHGTRRAPEERFLSARELVDALQVVLGSGGREGAPTPLPWESNAADALSVLAPSIGDAPASPHGASIIRPSSVPGLRRSSSTLIVGALLCVAVVLAIVAWQLRPSEPVQAPAPVQPEVAKTAGAATTPAPPDPAARAVPAAPTPSPSVAAPAPTAPTPAAPQGAAPRPAARAKRAASRSNESPAPAKPRETDLGF